MDLQTVKTNLEKKGYKVSVINSSHEIIEYLKANIKGMTVGFGGSQTLTELNLRHGCRQKAYGEV